LYIDGHRFCLSLDYLSRDKGRGAERDDSEKRRNINEDWLVFLGFLELRLEIVGRSEIGRGVSRGMEEGFRFLPY